MKYLPARKCYKYRCAAGGSLFRKTFLLSVGMLIIITGSKEVMPQMDSIIKPCTSGEFITIDSLHAYCGIPGECGKKLSCEDQTALIQGDIDYNNVFDKSTYPMLPYQKFSIHNASRSRTMEVWVNPEGSESVFSIIAEKKAVNPDGPVFVKGVLSGFDMPVMGKCIRELKLVLTGAGSISYRTDEPKPRMP